MIPGWKTPAEVFGEQLRSLQPPGVRAGPPALVNEDQLRLAIITWIERTYRRRRQRRLGRLTPVEYQTINQAEQAA
jgi:transposase InsO family protein